MRLLVLALALAVGSATDFSAAVCERVKAASRTQGAVTISPPWQSITLGDALPACRDVFSTIHVERARRKEASPFPSS